MANSDSSVLQETILRAMDAVVTQRNNELKLDKTITAIIKKNVGVRNNRAIYEVEYEGGRLVATAQNSTDSYIPNTSVYVLVPQGNFSNEKIIIGRASTISTDRSSSVVAAAANSYSIIGANLIESTSDEKIKNIEYGLHSFHDHITESSGHPSDHRFQVLYDINSGINRIKFNDNRLNIYKDQTTALMLKADFQTNLDIEQRRQSNARYGLLFNFSFDNLNKGFGETNGEIFENLAPIVEGKVIEYRTIGGQQEFETVDKTLADYHTEISESDFSNSILDMYIEYIQTLYNNFLINKKKLNTDLISNLVTAYLNLLNELKDIQTDIRKVQYENWWATQVGEPGQKIEQFVLTSDMMIGNPLSFSQWNTQYTVFTIDMNTFNHVESIYFFKEGFVENEIAESQWPLGNDFTENPYGGPDIFVKNIQIYAMKPLEAQSGDYSLKVEPYGGNDFILSAANPSTHFKATVLRQLYEDLTYNDKTSYYWFKESPAIINSSCDGYNYLAGVGWKYLYHTESKYLFSTTIEENPAYKNNYKCVAVYEPAADNKTILAVTFVVCNEDAAIKMKLESDIGTEFSFDQGIPTIKVLLHNNEMQEEEEYAEIGFKQDKSYTINNVIYPADSPKYLYTWAITDSVNGQKIFLADTADDENFLLVSAKQALLDRISHFTSIGYYDDEEEIREVEDTSFATRIKYPVYTTSSGFTVDCYLQERKPVIGGEYKYYDVGSAQLEFINQNENLASSDFRIQIVNGDQVFQYDEYGNAPTVNKLKEPLEIQPLQAKLISRSGLEIEGSNYNVEWIFPIENTLITTNETLVENSASQLIQSYHARECNFGIQEIYNPSYYNNQITCHISFNDLDLYKDTNFYFGKVGNNGTNGTDVVAKIEYAQNDEVNLLHYEPLTLYVQKGNGDKGRFNVRDADGNLNNFQSVKTLAKADARNSLLKLTTYQKNIALGEESYAAGYPKWGIAGSAIPGADESADLNNIGKFFEVENSLDNGSVLKWNYDYNNEKNFLRIQNLKAEAKLTTGETYYAYLSLPIIEYEEGQNLQLKLHKDTIAIDRPTYLNEIVYNADGRNPIYNHNAGLKLINLPKNAIVYWEAKGGVDGKKREYGTGFQEYYESTPNFSLAFEKDAINSYLYLISEYSLTHEADMRAAYDLERRQTALLYYTEIKNEEGEIIGYDKGDLYLAYEQKYDEDKEKAFSTFKRKALRKIQDTVKRAWIDEQPSDENGKIFTLKDGSEITQADIEEMYAKTEDFANSFWFTAHISEWWDDSNWDEDSYKLTTSEEEYNALSDEEKEKTYYYAESLLSPVDYFNSVFKTYDQFIQENKNVQTQIVTENSAMVYVLPNDSYSGAATNNRIEAKIYTLNADNERELYATVYAPINMLLNTFGLASVNAWDGNSITIDEDRGAILAPQIAAGEKDNNNRFTGIVMGKTESYTGESQNEKETGLFGYAYGLQSIFLDSETGNATFGLPDGHKVVKDRNGQYIGLGSDDYDEGRIELRPGDISKIGGWRLGRRSLYYTMTPDESQNIYDIKIDEETGEQISILRQYGYKYSGEIGPKYINDKDTPKKRQYGEHHEKDIKHGDSGILLSANPSYISVVGGILSQQEISEDANGHLTDGDAIEMQLDPKTPTVFTIFRHNGRNRGDLAGTRTYLAGINSKGQLQANSVGSAGDANNQTTMYIGRIKAFEQKINEDPAYVGSVFEAGDSADTLPFLTMFVKENELIQNGNINKNAHVYITGGNFGPTAEAGGENYGREISIHAKSLNLFAKDYDNNNKDKEITDANIQISTNSAQIQLGDNVGLLLNRSNSTNSYSHLKTSDNFNFNVGTLGNKKNLAVHANATTIAINGSNITNAADTIINNTGTTTITGTDSIILQKKDNSGNTTLGHIRFDVDTDGYNRVQLGIPAANGQKSLITLSNNNENTWDTIGPIKLNTSEAASQIILNINQDVTASGNKSGNAGSRNTTNTQILLQAGTHTRLGLTSSSTHWAGTQNSPGTGYPFYLDMGSIGTIATVTHHLADATGTDSNKMVNTLQLQNLNLQVSRGISITGNLSEYKSADKTIETSLRYSLIASNGIQIKQDASYYAFKSTNFSGNNKSPTYNNNGYYYVNSLTTLKDAIDNCLKAAGLAKAAADTTQDNLTNLIRSLGTAAYANTGDFRSSNWTPSASDVGAVSSDTFNNHKHSSGSGAYFVNATGVPTADTKTGIINNVVISSTTSTPQ